MVTARPAVLCGRRKIVSNSHLLPGHRRGEGERKREQGGRIPEHESLREELEGRERREESEDASLRETDK